MDDRVKPLTADQALERLRQVGRVEGESIAELGRRWGWKRERTSKAVIRWERAGHVEREAGPGGTIVIRVPGAVAPGDPADDPAPDGDVPAGNPAGTAADPAPDDARAPTVEEPAMVPAAVPAVPGPVKWHIVWRLVWRPGGLPAVPALYRWTFGGMSVALSFALYFISTFLNMTFWANLNPDVTAKEILAAGGLVIELINYAVPSAISFVPPPQWVLRLVVWAVLCFTMVATAIAGAGVVKNSLGASHVSRKETIEERDRLQGIVKSAVKPASDDAVKDARGRVDTAKANRKTTCAPTRTLDVDECNKSRAEVLKAEAALATENTNHTTAVTAAEQQHRKDVAGAQAKLDRLPVISVDLDIVTAGVDAIVPGVPEAWVTRGVVVLWVLLFSLGPCTLLRVGLVLLVPPRTAP